CPSVCAPTGRGRAVTPAAAITPAAPSASSTARRLIPGSAAIRASRRHHLPRDPVHVDWSSVPHPKLAGEGRSDRHMILAPCRSRRRRSSRRGRGISKGATMTKSPPTILEVQTHSRQEVIDITGRVESLLGDAAGGSCHLYLKHTTAGLMVVTSEAGVPEDVMDALQSLTPKLAYRHGSPAHVARHFLT